MRTKFERVSSNPSQHGVNVFINAHFLTIIATKAIIFPILSLFHGPVTRAMRVVSRWKFIAQMHKVQQSMRFNVQAARNMACLRLNVIACVANYHLYAETVLRPVLRYSTAPVCMCVFDDNYDWNNVIERSPAVNYHGGEPTCASFRDVNR